jgi:hypothetical protein
VQRPNLLLGIQQSSPLVTRPRSLTIRGCCPALELIRGQLGDQQSDERDLPFFASFAADRDLAERHEEILRTELGQ